MKEKNSNNIRLPLSDDFTSGGISFHNDSFLLDNMYTYFSKEKRTINVRTHTQTHVHEFLVTMIHKSSN